MTEHYFHRIMGLLVPEYQHVLAEAYLDKHCYMEDGTLIQDLRTGDIFRISVDEEKFHKVTCFHREGKICFTMNVQVVKVGTPGHFLGEEGNIDLTRDRFQIVPEVALLPLRDPEYRKAVVGQRMRYNTSQSLARIIGEPCLDSDGDWSVYIQMFHNHSGGTTHRHWPISDKAIIRWRSDYNDNPYYLE